MCIYSSFIPAPSPYSSMIQQELTDVRVFEWSSTRNHFPLITNVSMLSPVKSYPTWPVEPDSCLPLRCTQGDSLQGICHPERREGSRASVSPDPWLHSEPALREAKG